MGVDLITNRREFEVRKLIIAAYKRIRKRFRWELEHEFLDSDGKTVMVSKNDEVKRKAAAWYAVCYQDLRYGQPYTFAWVAYDYICEIASRIKTSPVLETKAIIATAHSDSSLSNSPASSLLPASSSSLSSSSSPEILGTDKERRSPGVVGNNSTQSKGLSQGLVDLLGDETGIARTGSLTQAEVQMLDMEQERARAAREALGGTNYLERQQPLLLHEIKLATNARRTRVFERVEYPMPLQEASTLPTFSSLWSPSRRESRAAISDEKEGFLTVGPDVDDELLRRALNFA